MEISPGLLISSALAGSLARVPTHPLDTIKARLMASPRSSSLTEIVRNTLRTEGVRGLYRGFWFTAVSSLPASCLYFTSQEWSRAHLFSNALLSGFFAETISCLIYVPIDVIKERIQVQALDTSTNSYGTYRSSLSAAKKIIGNEGIAGLYKGYLSTLGSFGPFSALYFYFYEDYRRTIVGYYGRNEIPGYAFWIGGGICGAAAAFLTTPLDLIKLRKQLDPNSPLFYRGNLFRGILSTGQREGVAGLFRGASARVLFFSPTTAFSMFLFEFLRGVTESS